MPADLCRVYVGWFIGVTVFGQAVPLSTRSKRKVDMLDTLEGSGASFVLLRDGIHANVNSAGRPEELQSTRHPGNASTALAVPAIRVLVQARAAQAHTAFTERSFGVERRRLVADHGRAAVRAVLGAPKRRPVQGEAREHCTAEGVPAVPQGAKSACVLRDLLWERFWLTGTMQKSDRAGVTEYNSGGRADIIYSWAFVLHAHLGAAAQTTAPCQGPTITVASWVWRRVRTAAGAW